VQWQRRHVEAKQAHVLHDQRVHAGLIQLPGQGACAFQFVVAQDGVHGHKNAAVEAVRVRHQPGNVGHRVVGAGARAKRRPANVDGVGPVVDGFHANGGIACRG